MFIPEAWFDEGHADKRKKDASLPGLTFKTKPELAAEMVEGILHEEILCGGLQTIDRSANNL